MSKVTMAKSHLMGLVGDEDTCTAFLLGGIGELNDKREPNFLVVKKGGFIIRLFFLGTLYNRVQDLKSKMLCNLSLLHESTEHLRFNTFLLFKPCSQPLIKEKRLLRPKSQTHGS